MRRCTMTFPDRARYIVRQQFVRFPSTARIFRRRTTENESLRRLVRRFPGSHKNQTPCTARAARFLEEQPCRANSSTPFRVARQLRRRAVNSLTAASGARGGVATLGVPDDRQGAGGTDQHAFSEHLAVEGHLPRVRARLRQEGKRHDRRRPQDRGAARRRRRAGLRLARSGIEGHARRRSRRARLSLRQAERRWRSGDRARRSAWMPTCCCPWHKYGGGKELLQKLYASIGANVVSFPVRTDVHATAWLVQEAGHQDRRTSRASSTAPWASRSICSPAWVRR